VVSPASARAEQLQGRAPENPRSMQRAEPKPTAPAAPTSTGHSTR